MTEKITFIVKIVSDVFNERTCKNEILNTINSYEIHPADEDQVRKAIRNSLALYEQFTFSYGSLDLNFSTLGKFEELAILKFRPVAASFESADRSSKALFEIISEQINICLCA